MIFNVMYRPLLNLHCTYLAKFNICMLTLQVQPPAERGGRGEPQPEQREDALPWLTIHTGNYRVQRLLVPYLYLINPDPGPHWAPLGSGFRVQVPVRGTLASCITKFWSQANNSGCGCLTSMKFRYIFLFFTVLCVNDVKKKTLTSL